MVGLTFYTFSDSDIGISRAIAQQNLGRKKTRSKKIWLMTCLSPARMFGAIKKLFGKTNAAAVATAPAEAPKAAAPQPKAAAGAPKASRNAVKASSAKPKSGDDVQVRLSSIVALLPKELKQGVTLDAKEELTLSIPREKILPQLAQGAVKITYQELKDSFPAGIFPNKPSEDGRAIDLPLQEILAQIEQRNFKRRSNQQAAVVPEDVTPLFSPKGEVLGTQVRLGKKEEKQSATEFRRKNAAAASAAPGGAPVTSPAPAPVSAPPAVVAAPVAAAAAQAAEAPTKPIAVNPHLASLMNQVASTPVNAPPYAPPKIESGFFSITLGDLSQEWPEGVATEIKVQQWTNLRCEIPVAELTTAMRQGKSQYSWKQIRTWIKPAPSGPSAHGEVPLEMPLKIIANLLLSQAQTTGRTAAPGPEKAQAPAPAPQIPIAAGAVPAATKPAPTPATPRTAAAPAASAPSGSTAFLNRGHTTSFSKKETVPVPLSAISSAWPEVLRKEIEHLNLSGATVAVPVEFLETALKQGKVAFFWKQVCQWIEACPPAAFASNFAEVRLEWPLSVIAPMFLQARPKKEPKAAPLHIDIPDVFAPKNQPPPAPAAAPGPTPKAASTAAPSQPTAEAPATPRKVPKDLAELFGEPEKRNWTPNEIVHKTCQLPGLDGALIALQDGLLVATCMPPTWKTETIAAFLPQIFGRMHQYTRELKMGELMSVTFTVEHGTLQIFNAGIIYFAALGKAGASLPVPELNLIARELSRHTK